MITNELCVRVMFDTRVLCTSSLLLHFEYRVGCCVEHVESLSDTSTGVIISLHVDLSRALCSV